jgi:hypothetical protein
MLEVILRRSYVLIMNRILPSLLLIVAAVSPAFAEVYAGKLNLTSEELSPGHPGNLRRYPVQFTVYDFEGVDYASDPTDLFGDFDDEESEPVVTRTADGFSFSVPDRAYLWDGVECYGNFTFGLKGEVLTMELFENCDNGWNTRAVYSGKIRKFPDSRQFWDAGSPSLKTFKSPCFSNNGTQVFEYEFWDKGGFRADFSLRLEECKKRGSRSLVQIKKNVRELYRRGTVKVKGKGRFRFSVSSSGEWSIKNRLY